jgi:plasmid stabilization system protein ParE
MPRAAGDAEAIYRRIIKEAPLSGSRWYGKLIETLHSLDRFPERGQAITSLSRSNLLVRRILFGRKPNVYRIYYSVEDDTVRILHIRHGARREPRFAV